MFDMQEELKKIQELETEAANRRAALHGAAVAEAQKIITDFGLTADDFVFADVAVACEVSEKRVHGNRGGKVAPKYAHAGKTWTGRGRTPAWIVEYESNGGSRDDFLI